MQHLPTQQSQQIDPFADPAFPGRRIGVSTMLLGLAACWIVAMIWLLKREEPETRATGWFLLVLVALVVAAIGSARRDSWRDSASLLLWGAFGCTLSIWMIGILSLGWLVFPVLLLELAALIAWPRPSGTSIVSVRGILLEIAGFLVIPVAVIPGFIFGM